MKHSFKFVAIVAFTNLICFWVAYGLLMSAWPHTGLGQFLGLEQTPPLSHWLVFLLWSFIILGAPTSMLLDGTGSEHFVLLLVLSSVLNCLVWSVCLGYPIHAFRKRFRNPKAQQARCSEPGDGALVDN